MIGGPEATLFYQLSGIRELINFSALIYPQKYPQILTVGWVRLEDSPEGTFFNSRFHARFLLLYYTSIPDERNFLYTASAISSASVGAPF
jgi:hypothetical protein